MADGGNVLYGSFVFLIFLRNLLVADLFDLLASAIHDRDVYFLFSDVVLETRKEDKMWSKSQSSGVDKERAATAGRTPPYQGYSESLT